MYYWNKTLHISESPSVHHQEFFTAHTVNLYDIYHCCVYSEKTPDDGRRNCPKHVEFYSKNKFQKLVHLVGFIIRIYHDARSPGRQKQCRIFCVKTAANGTNLIFCNCGSTTLISNDKVHLPAVINVSARLKECMDISKQYSVQVFGPYD